jgi:hypothetical protein
MALRKSHPRVKELSFQQLLNRPIRDLDLKAEGTLRLCLIQLRRELRSKHISYYPHFYFGEEPWGCIDRTGSVEIPFYVANKMLRRIAEKYYFSYSKDEIMMLLRHETGHAINYAYKLWKNEDWKKLFGNFHKHYREFYNYDAYSKDHVRYLHDIGNPHYAQKHPDEDFAETFAVWLDPASKWRWNYRRWKVALEKLRYVDRLFRVERRAERRPLRVRYDEKDSYKNIRDTIAEYFGIERKIDPRVREYTQDVREIFSGVGPRARRFVRADLFIQNYMKYLEEELVKWIAGAERREVREYLRELQVICALNNLRLHPDRSTEKLVELVIVSTYHVLQRLKKIR